MNARQKIRLYDYGSPFYRVYDHRLKQSIYFACHKYGGKRKAYAAAKAYLQSLQSSKLDKLLIASQNHQGLPRGLCVVAKFSWQTRNDRPKEEHKVHISVEARHRYHGTTRYSLISRTFSEAWPQAVAEFSQRMQLSNEENEKLLSMSGQVRKQLLSDYQRSCRESAIKTRSDIIAHIKQ